MKISGAGKWQVWEMFVDASIWCPCASLCRRIWQHFLISQFGVCPSRHCWPGNWPSGSSLSIRPLTNAIKGLLQTLPLPTTTKSFRFSNYTKFCQTARTMWCEHRRPGAGWEIEMLQLCWIQIHKICSVDAEAENVQAGEFWCKWHHWSGAGDGFSQSSSVDHQERSLAPIWICKFSRPLKSALE